MARSELAKRKRALLGWEWGEGLGHLTNLAKVADLLLVEGYEVLVATRDKKAAASVLTDPRIKLLQAPIWRRRLPSLYTETYDFSDVLYNFGFTDLACLSACIAGWKAMLDTYQPGLIVAEFAPCLLAASNGYPARRVQLGSSFGEPDPYRPGLKLKDRPADVCWPESHDAVLDNLNLVLSRLRVPTLECLADLYRVESTVLTTLPEIDVFGQRLGASYVGAFVQPKVASAPDWDGEGTARVFAYIKGRSYRFHSVMNLLSASPYSVIAYVPDARESEYLYFRRPGLRLHTQPLNAIDLIHQADVVVGHGGNGMLCQALLQGKPQFLAPNHLEQESNAQKAAALGVAVVADVQQELNYPTMLQRLLEDTAVKRATCDMKARYAYITPAWQDDQLLNALLP